jgi:hypothetical protein
MLPAGRGLKATVSILITYYKQLLQYSLTIPRLSLSLPLSRAYKYQVNPDQMANAE